MNVQETTVKGFSLLQPWASLIALGEKQVETRSWQTPYRGLVAIAASLRWDRDNLELAVTDSDFVAAWLRHDIKRMRELPLGAIVCVGRLTDCIRTEYFDPTKGYGISEEAFGNYAPGRYAWIFEDVVAIDPPIGVTGSLGLYDLSLVTRAGLAKFDKRVSYATPS